jgi:hypothetical protein
LESNVRLYQKDALHVRTCAHHDVACNLPEDVLRACTIDSFDWILLDLSRAILTRDIMMPAF